MRPLSKISMRKCACGQNGCMRLRDSGATAVAAATVILFASSAVLFFQTIRQRSHNAKGGERIYKSGCIACHGTNGSGAPETLTEFKRPETFPDFTRCDQTTPEPKLSLERRDHQWWAGARLFGNYARIWQVAHRRADRRLVNYYDSLSSGAAVILARAEATK